jgi:exosortase A
MNRTLVNADWRHAGPVLAGLLLLVLALYHSTVLSVLAKWGQFEQGEFAHGYLVLAISVYMVFVSRHRLAELNPCGNALGLFFIAFAGLLWLVAQVVDVQMVQAFAVVLLLMSVIWTITGNRVARQLLLPVLFLCFAIPIWSPLSPLLQELTADTVFWLTRAVGVPAMRHEQMIILPSGSLSVEEACSGLRYLLAALTLGVVYAWMNYQDIRARLLVVMIAAITAIISNIIRVFIVVYLAYKTNMQHPWVSDHLAFGWWMFGGMFAGLLVIDILLSRHSASPPAQAAITQHVKSQVCGHGRGTAVVIALLAAVLIAAGPVLAAMLEHQDETLQAITVELPAGQQGWSGPQPTTDNWMPRYLGAIASLQAYHKDGRTLLLYRGDYPVQQQGSELISDLNAIADQSSWRLATAQSRGIDGGQWRVIEQQITSITGETKLVWYWYRVAGVATTSRYAAKLLQVYGLLRARPGATIMAIAVGLDTDIQDTRQRLEGFVCTHELFMCDGSI